MLPAAMLIEPCSTDRLHKIPQAISGSANEELYVFFSGLVLILKPECNLTKYFTSASEASISLFNCLMGLFFERPGTPCPGGFNRVTVDAKTAVIPSSKVSIRSRVSRFSNVPSLSSFLQANGYEAHRLGGGFFPLTGAADCWASSSCRHAPSVANSLIFDSATSTSLFCGKSLQHLII